MSTGASVSHGTAVMGIAGGADNDLGWRVSDSARLSGPASGQRARDGARGERVGERSIGSERPMVAGCTRSSISRCRPARSNYEMVPSVNAAMRTAIANGVVVCVAAGNGDRDAGMDDSGNPVPETDPSWSAQRNTTRRRIVEQVSVTSALGSSCVHR